MQGHGRVTAESWVVGEVLPLSCLREREREKKKSFVIVTEKGCCLSCFGGGEGKGNDNNWIGTKHAFKTERADLSSTYFKWFPRICFAPQVALVLNACFAPIRSV